MTEEEHREETRDQLSDPHISRQRRQRRQQMAQQAIGPEVARADMILLDGSLLAVALQYEQASMPAPRVLAKGTGSTAADIYRVALQHGRWIVDAKKLARELYRRVPAYQEVPPDLYPAVASLFADQPHASLRAHA